MPILISDVANGNSEPILTNKQLDHFAAAAKSAERDRPGPAIDDWPPRRSAASLKRTLVISLVSKLSLVRRKVDVDVVAIGVAQMKLNKPNLV